VFPAGKFEIHNNVRWIIGGLAAIAVIIAVLYFTGAWDYLRNSFSGEGSTIVTNIIIIVLIAVAIAIVVGVGGKKEEKKE
jgi:multisubunit Na+/H+ antiporter MnhB subunit